MPTEVQQMRDLARSFWKKEPIACPKHPGALMTGELVRTTYADHLVLHCKRGKETVTIPQRPTQQEFNEPQIEGLMLNLQRGDNVLCYRCQSQLGIDRDERANTGEAHYAFTCVRCFSFGFWSGKPAELSIVASKA